MMEKVLLPFFDVAVWIKEERAMAKALFGGFCFLKNKQMVQACVRVREKG